MKTGDKNPRVLDAEHIARLLPHDYPLQLVDRVVELEPGCRIVALKNLSRTDFYFRGHFPQRPVMPGVLICEALAQAGALLARTDPCGVPASRAMLLAGIDRARFRRIVVPGDQLRLEVELRRRRRPYWKLSGRALVDGELAAEAEILAVEAEWSALR